MYLFQFVLKNYLSIVAGSLCSADATKVWISTRTILPTRQGLHTPIIKLIQYYDSLYIGQCHAIFEFIFYHSNPSRFWTPYSHTKNIFQTFASCKLRVIYILNIFEVLYITHIVSFNLTYFKVFCIIFCISCIIIM